MHCAARADASRRRAGKTVIRIRRAFWKIPHPCPLLGQIGHAVACARRDVPLPRFPSLGGFGRRPQCQWQRAAKGHAAAEPNSVMNWRRFNRSPRQRAQAAWGDLMPSAFAVFRLITSSYLVGDCTGRSAGFSPLRMRST